MARIKPKAQAAKPGQWLIVAGGWTPQQFAEKRRPTPGRAGRRRAGQPGLYPAVLQRGAADAAGAQGADIANDADVPPRGKIERDADGNPTGWIAGDNLGISALFDKLPLPTFERERRRHASSSSASSTASA